jgi:type II secretory pathway pseudopilin PulG
MKCQRQLDLRKTSPDPGSASTNSEDIFSDGSDPVGSLTAEKWLLDGDSGSGMVGILRKSSKSGFTAVELLVTMFVAVAFLGAGYQLYSLIIKDGGQTRAQARAANTAYDYLRQYSLSADTPSCAASTPFDSSVSVAGLTAVTVTVDLSCPYATTTNITKIDVTVRYNNPQQTVKYATYVKL